MPFAINQHGGWRSIDSEADLLEGETYSEEQPPIVELPSVPQEVTRFQALAALHLNGLLARVKAIMADPATDPLTVLAFDSAQTFKRYSPMVLAMAAALSLTDQQLDDLFISASKIE